MEARILSIVENLHRVERSFGELSHEVRLAWTEFESSTGGSQRDFAKRLGIAPSSLSDHLVVAERITPEALRAAGLVSSSNEIEGVRARARGRAARRQT